jgi:hypothetical protein
MPNQIRWMIVCHLCCCVKRLSTCKLHTQTFTHRSCLDVVATTVSSHTCTNPHMDTIQLASHERGTAISHPHRVMILPST